MDVSTEPTRPGPHRLVAGPLIPEASNPSRRRWRRRLIRLAVTVAVVGLIVALHRPILSGFARIFWVDDPVESDAIVVLIGGLGHRSEHGATLYHRGIAPRVRIGTSTTDEDSS